MITLVFKTTNGTGKKSRARQILCKLMTTLAATVRCGVCRNTELLLHQLLSIVLLRGVAGP